MRLHEIFDAKALKDLFEMDSEENLEELARPEIMRINAEMEKRKSRKSRKQDEKSLEDAGSKTTKAEIDSQLRNQNPTRPGGYDPLPLPVIGGVGPSGEVK